MAQRLHFFSYVLSTLSVVFTIGCSGDSAGVGDGSSSDPFAPRSSGSGSGSGSKTGSGSGSGTADSLDPEGMFGPPRGTATPGSIFGLWGGATTDLGTTFDMRARVAATSITFANRCTLQNGKRSGIVSVTAAARVTEDTVVVLETKQDQKDDGIVRCSVSLTPRQLERCAADVHEGFERNCFQLTGTKLEMYGETSFEHLSFTKLSD